MKRAFVLDACGARCFLRTVQPPRQAPRSKVEPPVRSVWSRGAGAAV